MLLRHAFWLLPALLVACIPAHAAYLTIPVANRTGLDLEAAVVWVPLAELAARMDGFDAASFAFYVEGRTPLPFRLHDLDGDGRADVAFVAIAVRSDGSTRLVVVSPGPPAAGEASTDPPMPGVELLFDHASD